MANDNHLLSVTCYNVTMLNNKYYNEFFELGQQKINFKFYELSLPDDDPVFTLKKVMEAMDFTALLAQYSGKGKHGFNSKCRKVHLSTGYPYFSFKAEKSVLTDFP